MQLLRPILRRFGYDADYHYASLGAGLGFITHWDTNTRLGGLWRCSVVRRDDGTFFEPDDGEFVFATDGRKHAAPELNGRALPYIFYNNGAWARSDMPYGDKLPRGVREAWFYRFYSSLRMFHEGEPFATLILTDRPLELWYGLDDETWKELSVVEEIDSFVRAQLERSGEALDVVEL